MSATSTRTRAGVRAWAYSTTYVANELVNVLQNVVVGRGLPIDYMHRHGELFTTGFRTWIASRWLEGVVLEIYDPRSDAAVERVDLTLEYQTSGDGGGERFDTLMEKVKSQLAAMPSLRPGCQYRVVVTLAPGAPDLPGWAPTTLRDASHLPIYDLGAVIDTSRIGVSMAFRF